MAARICDDGLVSSQFSVRVINASFKSDSYLRCLQDVEPDRGMPQPDDQDERYRLVDRYELPEFGSKLISMRYAMRSAGTPIAS
jgi:hypothetical protein